jgi:hypothetical protein
MALLDDPENLGRLIDLIGYVSIVAAAGFGLLGLFTEYKKDGRVTRWGKAAAGGIALSATLGLTSSMLQQRAEAHRSKLSRETADKERRESNNRYRKQLARLVGISDGLIATNKSNETIIQGVQRSLEAQTGVVRSQGMVLDRAQRTMLLTAGLSRQEGENTARVLRTMWDDANRIVGRSMELAIAYRCSPLKAGAAFATILGDGSSAEVRVAPRSSVSALREPLHSFRSDLILPDSSAVFGAYDQQVTTRRTRSVDGDDLLQFSRFSGFRAGDMKGLHHPDAWRDVVVEVLVSGNQPGLAGQARAAFDEGEVGDKAALRNRYAVPEEILANDDYEVTVLPCTATMSLLLNERSVAVAQGLVVQVNEYDEDRRGRVVVKFPVVRANADAFPKFGNR